jgi:hypothetical protein
VDFLLFKFNESYFKNAADSNIQGNWKNDKIENGIMKYNNNSS